MDNNCGPSRDLLALTVLALLSEGPHHPYAIQQTIRDRRITHALGSARALYRAVQRLTAAGWVEPAETSRCGRRPERTIYRITPAGRDELPRWLMGLVETPLPEAPAIEGAVSLLGYLPAAAAARALRLRTVALRGQVAALAAAQEQLEADLNLPRLVLLELEAARARLRAELDWAAAIAGDFERGALTVDRGRPGEAEWPPPGPAADQSPADPLLHLPTHGGDGA